MVCGYDGQMARLEETMKRNVMMALLAAASFAGAVWAQSSAQEQQGYQDRMTRQQNRIQAGEQSGQLTTGEANRLERNDARINREASRMSARTGGNLTNRQEARLSRQMNRNSRAIARGRHNRRVQ